MIKLELGKHIDLLEKESVNATIMRDIAATKCVFDFRISFYSLQSKHKEVKKYVQAALMLLKSLSTS